MGLKSAQQWSGLIITKDATGALSAASVGPAGTLYVNGTSNGASVTVSGSNPYKWTVTLPALTAGDLVSMYVTATIDSIATAEVVAEDVADTKRVSDLNDIAAGAAMTISGTLTTFDAIWTKIQKWLRLALRKDAATATDCATELTEINSDGGSGAGAYANTTDSQEAIRDQGDSAWITATGFAVAGNQMDLVDAPNATAITAIQDGLAQTGVDGDTLETLSDQIDLQATAVALATAQADLDNPAQYKADVSALALEATAQSILTDTGTALPTDIAALPTAVENADQVWEEALADHSGTVGSTAEALNAAGAAGDPWITALPGAYVAGQAGYIVGTTITGALTSIAGAVAAAAAAVWAYATRTLTQTAQQIGDAIDGSTITIHRGDEFNEQMTDLGAIPADRTAFWFTVKTDPEDDDDDEAIIQIKETTGLLYLNATAATVAQAALASLTVDDEATGDVTIWISDSITAALARTSGISYDFQYLDAGGEAHTLASGTLAVTADVTRATTV